MDVIHIESSRLVNRKVGGWSRSQSKPGVGSMLCGQCANITEHPSVGKCYFVTTDSSNQGDPNQRGKKIFIFPCHHISLTYLRQLWASHVSNSVMCLWGRLNVPLHKTDNLFITHIDTSFATLLCVMTL